MKYQFCSLLTVVNALPKFDFSSNHETETNIECIDSINDPYGLEYNGNVSQGPINAIGKFKDIHGSIASCIPWNQVEKHQIRDFPVYKESHNFCRNPDGDKNGPWCYIDYASLGIKSTKAISNYVYCKTSIDDCDEVPDLSNLDGEEIESAKPVIFKDFYNKGNDKSAGKMDFSGPELNIIPDLIGFHMDLENANSEKNDKKRSELILNVIKNKAKELEMKSFCLNHKKTDSSYKRLCWDVESHGQTCTEWSDDSIEKPDSTSHIYSTLESDLYEDWNETVNYIINALTEVVRQVKMGRSTCKMQINPEWIQ